MIYYSHSNISRAHYWKFNKGVLARTWWYLPPDAENHPDTLIYDSEKGDDLLEFHKAIEAELRLLMKVVFEAKKIVKADNS
jgi:hypothetical protein